jgi:hypothetical protein
MISAGSAVHLAVEGDRRGRVLAVYTMFGAVTGIVGRVLTGSLVERLGLERALLWLAALGTVAVLASLRYRVREANA